MADGSAIEWTDATWNPVTGCTKITRGCDNCYAERFAERWRGVPDQARTGATFYTPFFIHSTDSHRSYWLLHLSNHRQARDEMGKLHWRLNNHFQHHGGAGFHALGFDPSKDLRQGLLTFMFDDDAMKRSEAAVLEQLPRMIHAANRDGGGDLGC